MLFQNIHVLCPDGSILPNAYVQTTSDTITYVGQKPPQNNHDHCYNGQNKLLIPGFVNAHCHVPMTLLRSVGAGLPLDKWLNNAIFPLEGRMTSAQSYTGALLGIAEMLKSGITSFTDMYLFGHACCEAVLDSGIKANVSMGVTCFDDTSFEQLAFVQETKEMVEQYHNIDCGRIKIDAGIHGEYTSNPRIVQAMGEFAKQHHLNTHIHLSETKEETQACIARHHKTPAAYFESLGFFENPTTAAHCVYITEQDMDILASNQVTVAHCPISNLKLGSGIADVVKMQTKGIRVAMGTDGVASNDNLYFFEDMKLTSLLQKGCHCNPTALPALEVLGMSTKNGALSQGRTNTGEISVGLKADIAVIDFNAIHLTPTVDYLNTLLYAAAPSDVCLTMVDGKVLYENGNFLTIDIEKVMSETKKISKALHS